MAGTTDTTATDTASTTNEEYVKALRADTIALQNSVSAAIEDVIKVAGESLSATFDLDDWLTSISLPDWHINTVDLPDVHQPANWAGFNIPEFVFNPTDYISADMLERYSYQSDFFDNFLDSRLREYIDSQAYFLAQEVQDALFQESRERDLQTLRDSLDVVTREQGRRGFPMPTSMLMAARNEIIKKYQDTYADRNKEITALIADKSLQEKMHAMDTGIKMEDIRSRFQLEFGRLYWQAADYLVKKYATDVQAEVSRIESDIKAFELQLTRDVKSADYWQTQVNNTHDKEKTRLSEDIKETIAQVTLWQEQYKARIKAAEQFVDYYKANIMGNLGSYNAVDYVDKKA